MLSLNEIKQKLGSDAAQIVQPGMSLGIGSGSTVIHFIKALAERVRGGLKCIAVPTSENTRIMATNNDIKLVELNDVKDIDVTIDGADEIDPALQLIKGGGGALLQEKMVAAASKQLIIIADHTKLVAKLGDFPLPVEVVPYGWKQVLQRIRQMHKIEAVLRKKNDQPFITDHGHYILDCRFIQINEPLTLNSTLNLIPGVVETGLFINMTTSALIGYPDGNFRHISVERK